MIENKPSLKRLVMEIFELLKVITNYLIGEMERLMRWLLDRFEKEEISMEALHNMSIPKDTNSHSPKKNNGIIYDGVYDE